MKDLQVTHPEELRLVFEAFSHLDDIRWNTEKNYNLINYCRKDLTADEKLLTHWLCYITDRQMPYMRIWDVGGYVISHLVAEYSRNTKQPVRSIFESYAIINQDKQLKLKCPVKGKNKRLDRYPDVIVDDYMTFSSRYMPQDLIHFYRTLLFLDRVSKRSLSRYLADATGGLGVCKDSVYRMAVALDDLTYNDTHNFSANEFKSGLRAVDKKVGSFEVNYEKVRKLFARKRLWCSLRDYLKSPHFNDALVKGLRQAGYRNASKWKRTNPDLKRAMSVIELPGDVWNNSEIFRSGLFRPYIENERPSWNMPQTVRKIYEIVTRYHEVDFYPEQLDVTFSFVPKMCEQGMCHVCLFGKGIQSLCHERKGTLCPVALVSCNYCYECTPSKCWFKLDKCKGLCQRSEATG